MPTDTFVYIQDLGDDPYNYKLYPAKIYFDDKKLYFILKDNLVTNNVCDINNIKLFEFEEKYFYLLEPYKCVKKHLDNVKKYLMVNKLQKLNE